MGIHIFLNLILIDLQIDWTMSRLMNELEKEFSISVAEQRLIRVVDNRINSAYEFLFLELFRMPYSIFAFNFVISSSFLYRNHELDSSGYTFTEFLCVDGSALRSIQCKECNILAFLC